MRKSPLVPLTLLFALVSACGSAAAEDLKARGQTLDLAAAYVVEGMLEEARPLLESFPEKLRKTPGANGRRYSSGDAATARLALQWTLLHEMLDPGRKDAFDLLIDVLAREGLGTDERDPLSTVLWQKVFARYALREGYPSIAAYVLGRSREYLGYRLEPGESSGPSERAAATAQLEEITREVARLEEKAPSGAPGREAAGSGGSDPIGPLLTHLVEAPRLFPFREI